MSQDYPHYGDNFIPVIFVDEIIHTEQNPRCADPSCPCQAGEAPSLDLVNQFYQDGLITAQHADAIIQGKMPL